MHLPEHLTNPPRPTLGLLGAGTAGPEGFLRFLPWAGPAPWASALIPRGRGHRGGLANGRLELLLFFCWGRVPGAWSLKRSGTALPSPGWEGEEAESYVWVTWRLLVFGPDSAASAPGEEAVTTREAVVVAAAAGGREEVGLALRGVWPLCPLRAAAFRGTGGVEPGASGQFLPVRLGGERIPHRPITKAPVERDVCII